MVKTSPSNTGGEGSIPGGELRSHVVRGQKIKQKQYCNKFNKDFKNGPLKKNSLNKKVSFSVQGFFFYCHWSHSREHRMWPGALVWISMFPCPRECLNQWLWPHVLGQNWPQTSAQDSSGCNLTLWSGSLTADSKHVRFWEEFPGEGRKAGREESTGGPCFLFVCECCPTPWTMLHTHSS